MTLQFSGKSEMVMPYKAFPQEGTGRMIDIVPQAVAQGYALASVAQVADRRMNAPEDARPVWRNNYVFTADAFTRGTEGDSVFTLDEEALLTLTPEVAGSLIAGALPRSAEEFAQLREDGLYLSAEQTAELNGKGWAYSGGVWKPEAPVVAEVTDFVLRGMSEADRIQYLNGVRDDSKSNRVMRFYHGGSNDDTVLMRSVVVDGTRYDSIVDGDSYLYSNNARLVGVAPEAPVAREKLAATDLEGTLQTADVGSVLEDASRLNDFAPNQVTLLRNVLEEGGYQIVKPK